MLFELERIGQKLSAELTRTKDRRVRRKTQKKRKRIQESESEPKEFWDFGEKESGNRGGGRGAKTKREIFLK